MPKPSNKPLFVPSNAAVEFWENNFSRFSEVSLIDYLNSLIPILEKETERKFTNSQLINLIDILNYENRFKINKYESYFFIDAIWNSADSQYQIWNSKLTPVSLKIRSFRHAREEKRALEESRGVFIAPLGFEDEDSTKLSDILTPLECLKVPSHRNNMFVLRCTKSSIKYYYKLIEERDLMIIDELYLKEWSSSSRIAGYIIMEEESSRSVRQSTRHNLIDIAGYLLALTKYI